MLINFHIQNYLDNEPTVYLNRTRMTNNITASYLQGTDNKIDFMLDVDCNFNRLINKSLYGLFRKSFNDKTFSFSLLSKDENSNLNEEFTYYLEWDKDFQKALCNGFLFIRLGFLDETNFSKILEKEKEIKESKYVYPFNESCSERNFSYLKRRCNELLNKTHPFLARENLLLRYSLLKAFIANIENRTYFQQDDLLFQYVKARITNRMGNDLYKDILINLILAICPVGTKLKVNNIKKEIYFSFFPFVSLGGKITTPYNYDTNVENLFAELAYYLNKVIEISVKSINVLKRNRQEVLVNLHKASFKFEEIIKAWDLK